jgi:hypothetical protein
VIFVSDFVYNLPHSQLLHFLFCGNFIVITVDCMTVLIYKLRLYFKVNGIIDSEVRLIGSIKLIIKVYGDYETTKKEI